MLISEIENNVISIINLQARKLVNNIDEIVSNEIIIHKSKYLLLMNALYDMKDSVTDVIIKGEINRAIITLRHYARKLKIIPNKIEENRDLNITNKRNNI